jgi:hypothetical protein
MPLPPATTLLFNHSETATQLSRLIVEYSHVERWVFKIDGDINSRGIAYFDVHSVKRLGALVKNHANAAVNENGENTATTSEFLMTKPELEGSNRSEPEQPKQSSLLFAEIQREVQKMLPKKLQFAKRGVYKDYFDFIEEFCRRGGIIEASPTVISKSVSAVGVLFQLEPDGEVEIQTTFEKLLVAPFNSCGFKFPQSALPNLNVALCHLDKSPGRKPGVHSLPERNVRIFRSGATDLSRSFRQV